MADCVDVTVVTATLNAAAFLQECIDSVRSQTSQELHVEHLFVDDGSVDGTLEIADRNGIRVIPGRGAGLYDALNVGTWEAKGSIISVLGSDDLLLPGALSAAVRQLGQSGNPWLIGGLRWISVDGSSLGYIGPPPPWMTVEMYASLGWSCIHHQTTFLTRQFFEHLGGYDTSFRVAGDYELLARALGAARPALARVPLGCFRRYGSNLSARSPLVDRENAEVAKRYGPRSSASRQLNRQILRWWLNARHPGWFMHKYAGELLGRRPIGPHLSTDSPAPKEVPVQVDDARGNLGANALHPR